MAVVGSPDLRILFVALPALPRELLERALASDGTMTVVGDVQDLAVLPEVVRSTRANVLIVGTEDSALPERCRLMLNDGLPPDTLVMPLDGGDAVLVVARTESRILGDLSADELVAAIQRSVRERPNS